MSSFFFLTIILLISSMNFFFISKNILIVALYTGTENKSKNKYLKRNFECCFLNDAFQMDCELLSFIVSFFFVYFTIFKAKY